jgi:hypothetical protein
MSSNNGSSNCNNGCQYDLDSFLESLDHVENTLKFQVLQNTDRVEQKLIELADRLDLSENERAAIRCMVLELIKRPIRRVLGKFSGARIGISEGIIRLENQLENSLKDQKVTV